VPTSEIREAFAVAQFREKPDLETAKQYIAAGYLFNSGMFAFPARHFAQQVQKYAPAVFQAFEKGSDAEKFEATPAISIDYGILEHTPDLGCVPLRLQWRDVGSFASFFAANHPLSVAAHPTNEYLGQNLREIRTVDSTGVSVYSDSARSIALLGVDNLLVVELGNQLLIADKAQLDQIRRIHDPENIAQIAQLRNQLETPQPDQTEDKSAAQSAQTNSETD
jgi:mannose-1-phosphate guanylyltransferase/mannose-6-phosphate isomerase